MFFQHKAFWLPKDVEQPVGYQDAFAVDEVRGLAAIADGVSSSLFAASWARLLVQAAVSQPPDVSDAEAVGNWLAAPRQLWRQSIDAESLAWHQKAKFNEGAFTTLMWVELSSSPDSNTFPFRCYSLGDCCLFHVRDDQVLRGFPFEQSALFDTKPKMVGSVARGSGPLEFDVLEDVCRAGDLLVLCTDALAVWALMQLEAGDSPRFESCWNMSQRDWTESILRLRAEDKIRYDDTTVQLLRVKGESESVTDRAMRSGTDLVDDVKKNFSQLFSSGKSRRKRR